MNDTVAQELAQLRGVIADLIRYLPHRLTAQQVCERLHIHRNTLRRWVNERRFPKPGPDGNWALQEVMDWERRDD